MAGKEIIDDHPEYQAKICIDDLEVPVRKAQTPQQIIVSIERNFTPQQANTIRMAYESMKNNPHEAEYRWKDFEKTLGKIKGFKYFWAFAVACHQFGSRLHQKLKQIVKETDFRSPTCVLSKHGTTYKSIFKYLSKKLAEFLSSKVDELESFPEKKLNTVIRSIFGHETGLLIQGQCLQRYISPNSSAVLMHIFFADKSNYSDMFEDCKLQDLITVFLYWSIIRIKSSQEVHTTPGFRGVDWIREVIGKDIDLSFIKVSTQEEIREKKMEYANRVDPADRSEFPTLGENGTQSKEKNIFELMKQSRNQYSNSINAYTNRQKQPVMKKAPQVQKPKPEKRVTIAQPRYDSSEDEKPQPVQIVKGPAPAKGKEKEQIEKRNEPRIQDQDNWPSLSNQPIPKHLIPDPTPPRKKKSPEIQKRSNLNENDFPNLGGLEESDAGPNILEMMKSTNGKGGGKKKPGKAQTKPTQQKESSMKEREIAQSKSIFAIPPKQDSTKQPAKGKEDEFPSLPSDNNSLLIHQSNQSLQEAVPPQPKKPASSVVAIGNYKEVDTFDDPPPKKKQEKKEKAQKLSKEDFPTLKEEEGPTLQDLMSKKFDKRDRLLELEDDDFPSELAGPVQPQAKVNYGKKSNKLKPSVITKYEDLKDDDGEEELKDQNKKRNKGYEDALKNLNRIERGEEDFPTLGDPSQPKPKPDQISESTPKPTSIRTALINDNPSVIIMKKQSKKK